MRENSVKDLYPNAEEDILPNVPEPRDESVEISIFVDVDHTGNKINRRSQTGIIIFMNQTPINFLF